MALAIIAAVVAFAIIFKKCNNNAKTVNTVRQIARIDTTEVRRYKDLYGVEHARNELIIATNRDMQLMYGSQIDSLTKQLRIRARQLQSMAIIQYRDTGSIITNTVVVHDTLTGKYVYSFNYSDSTVSVWGEVDSASAHVQYQVYAQLNIATFWKRRWFLGRKKYYIDATSPNENIHITNLKGYKIN